MCVCVCVCIYIRDMGMQYYLLGKCFLVNIDILR